MKAKDYIVVTSRLNYHKLKDFSKNNPKLKLQVSSYNPSKNDNRLIGYSLKNGYYASASYYQRNAPTYMIKLEDFLEKFDKSKELITNNLLF